MPLDFSPRDRLIVLAPHPDDESLATGGLILRARSAGASVHIIFATNGDNNPWPQRWVERRLRIGPKEKQRWGARRQAEARAAVARLGLPKNAASFLNLPDQGTPELLRRRDETTIAEIARIIAEFRPTLSVIPSQYDLHRDHNALHLIWQIAEARAFPGAERPRQLHYLVHFREPHLAPTPLYLNLTEAERVQKTEAILCHQTQMFLSKKRFLGYVRPEESYHLPPPVCEEESRHAVRRARVVNGVLRITLFLPRRRFGSSLHLCGEDAKGTPLRWSASIPLGSGIIRPSSTTHSELHRATLRIEGDDGEVAIPLPSSLGLTQLYAKFQRPTVFLDQTGWRTIPLPG